MASKPPLPSPAVAGPSTARRQPLRQARTARKPATSKLTTNGTEPSAHHLPPAKFYPALAAFTDAVDALPSEIIRHFTLLREVDAKACLPEVNLRALIDAAERLPAASDPYEFDAAMESLKQLDELRRRRDADPLFIADLLVTQDEKIHVITTAVEALQKHLARVEHAFAYVEVEIPEIYRLGNREHWAYKEPMKKGTAAQIAREKERERREQEERLHQMQVENHHHPPAINTKAKPSNSSGGEPKSAASTTGTPGGSRNRKRTDSNATSASVPPSASEPTKKKSHKARSQQKPGAAPIGLGISTTTTGTKKDKEQEESGDEDGSEERYCYCNGVSYGEMVACDEDDCEKEWFHLECAGLTQAPKGKVKWYCRDCEAIRGRGRSRA
ncbi:hypothetical protein BDD12DRAFT_788948 [Trichophaea hybrida]|nr:hypothetical protein BDD12DRAFT_788948 [Trichophaea hybrida]